MSKISESYNLPDNTTLPTYGVWQQAIQTLTAAQNALIAGENQNTANRVEWRELLALYNSRYTLYCAGGSGGKSYTLLGGTNYNCSTRSDVLESEQQKYNIAVIRLDYLGNQAIHQYEVDTVNGGRNKLKAEITTAEKNELKAYENYVEEFKKNLTPQQIADFNNVQLEAEEKEASIQMKKYLIIGGIVIVILSIAGYLIYKYVVKKA